MQSKKTVFDALEKLMGEAFTDNIPEILTTVGFDTKTALKSMNNQCITSIENFVNQNKSHFQDTLKGTKYENAENFKFLPGHCALILSLPQYVEALSSKNRRGKKRKHCETLDHPQSNNADHPDADIINNIDDSVKILLINKINNYAMKKKLNIKIDDNSILNFRHENNSYKCSVQCSVCEKTVPCQYVKHWVCGNFETHIKKHLGQQSVEEYEVQDDNQLQLMGHSSITNITRVTNQLPLQQFLNSN